MFKLHAFLADAAQVVGGKLYVLGGGWSIIQPGAPFAICGKIEIPWHVGTDWHTLVLELVDGDGHPVVGQRAPELEPEPVIATHPPYRATIGPNVKPGTALDWPFAVSMTGVPLEAGRLYEWRISINGETKDGWSLPFSTPPAPLANVA